DFSEAADQQLQVRRFLNSLAVPQGNFCEEVLSSIQQKQEEPENVISLIQGKRSKQRRFAWAAIGLASAALIAVSVLLTATLKPASAPKVRVIAAEGIGTLNSEALENGKSIRLRRGILELELNGESRVVIEAPARFKVVTPRLLRLNSGRCFAEMEKGKSGLRIETPKGEVLDLGTRFAVDVSSPDEMKVHVFDGEVEVSDGATKRRLKEGEGVRVAESGVADESADSSLFVPRVPKAVMEETPFIHWSFDEGQGAEFNAMGRDLQPELGAGVIVQQEQPTQSKWTTGIIQSALDLKRNGWATTQHPGISGNQDRTVACWIRLPAEHQSLEVAPLVTWGLQKQKPRGKAWMFSVARFHEKSPETYGVLRLNVGGQTTFGSTNLRDGRWRHVAAVAMEGEHGASILLYVDGQLEDIRRDRVKSLDTLTDHKSSEPVQFGRHLFLQDELLRGSIDEVYIFEAALSGDEIRQLMHSPKSEF
ncbi:MAG: LamG-like jellyroll fold domain-containing protein, partial [Verrucomicrobiota bacterium]